MLKYINEILGLELDLDLEGHALGLGLVTLVAYLLTTLPKCRAPRDCPQNSEAPVT